LRTTTEPAERVRALLAAAHSHGSASASSNPVIESASVTLAEELAREVARETTRSERSRYELLARLGEDPAGQTFTTSLTDRAYRSRDRGRVVDVARQLLRRLGVPGYLPAPARAQLKLLLHAGPFVPQLAAKGLLHRLRSETRDVVLDASPDEVRQHLAERYAQGVRVNLNYLGEAVLGERAAAVRCEEYLALLARPEVRAISVKLSSIVRPFELLAWDETLEELRPRLRSIYRAALEHRYPGPRGSTPKLVSLDMEAYRDLELTFDLFRGLLDEPELLALPACLVLQAYLPDAFALQRELTRWAQARVARGGAPVRMRLVKGANLAAEGVESAARGWPLPMYGSKLEVDANYKRMLEYACEPDRAQALQLGIASHNLFDIALGLVLRAQHNVEAHVGFELLEGMADPLRRVLSRMCDDVLVYCPIVEASSMQTAIAYLMRRLDENLAPENFLRRSFGMQVGDANWVHERDRFTAAFERRTQLSEASLRTQDRSREPEPLPAGAEFSNEPDTDFALAQNRRWIWSILERWRTNPCVELPTTGGVQSAEREFGFDPSRPEARPYSYPLAAPPDIERVLATAETAVSKLATSRADERAHWLSAIAQELRRDRGELIAAMALDAGKRVEQADAEVSEAIDFAEYYARSYLEHAAQASYRLQPRGVVLVTPPWNFPLAIPAGGVFAGLMAGNAVILKPALETVWVAYRLAEACWRAGVPRDVLQFVVCRDEVGSQLVSDPRVSAIVLTGASSTARLFQRMRPGISLFAETGGKNAVIVSAAADRDQAIKDVVQSAFGHAGQKCSAASLLICEAEVYDDPSFRDVLADAVASLPVGSAWDLRSIVTPLIQPPAGALARALSQLEPGERWLVEPRVDASNPRLMSPGVKIDVAAGSFTHTTELFGPVLAIMRADDLDHALALANATPYGLTAGLFSLDEREQLRWSERMLAGNLYINRSVTGAIVRRQPFGGCKASSFGPGAKAGGPNYLLQLSRVSAGADETVNTAPVPAAADFLGHIRRKLTATDQAMLSRAACTYGRVHTEHFARAHDPSALPGEINAFRYRPCASLMIRAAADAVLGDVLLACVAGLTAGAKLTLSMHTKFANERDWLAGVPRFACVVEDEEPAAARVGTFERVRLVGSAEVSLREAAEEAGVHVATEPVLKAGRIELLHYLREQSLSVVTHRYGSLHAESLSPFDAD
jgi:RHH-type proline utilization regulon transcriptional repressor/proline dehydrogenase/delta 1-pyrroline-5-carboxylate dehydrogenase